MDDFVGGHSMLIPTYLIVMILKWSV